IALLAVVLGIMNYAVYAERRISALIQDRLGPNRVGPAGLFQPIADAAKFLLKEEFTPRHVNTFYYWLAPCLAMIPAITTLAVIPIFLVIGQLRLTEVVRYQIEHGWMIAPFIGDWTNAHKWLLAIPMLISFVVFMIAIFAETNRLPFDLPEAETELVGGYNTE